MILQGLVTGAFQGNCFIAGCERTREALVVDPGDDVDHILAALERHQLTVKLIACTHAHIDHIGAVQPLRDATQAPLAMHRDAYDTSGGQSRFAAAMTGRTPQPLTEPEQLIDEGDELAVGDLRFQVLYCPGHAPGHLCFHGEGVVFTGDVLFQSSIGRFDLPGGDGRLLLRNIRDKLLVLPDEAVVLPGHGPTSTIGQEKQQNPFILHPRTIMGIDPD
jgi:glyoxylase-like metal-dependent hydrolase (beta-lactamase superfamily II)